MTRTKLLSGLLALALLFAPNFAFAAIAFDNSTTNTSSGTSITISNFAVAATNPFLTVVVSNWGASTDLVTGITYNGVAMTLLSGASTKIENGNPTEGYMTVYYLAGQSGTHNIVISSSGAGIGASSGISVASYTGVNQASPIDSSAVHTYPSNTTAPSVSTTVVASNAWAISMEADGNGSGESVDSPFTLRLSPQTYIRYADSNGTVPTGSLTAQWHNGSAQASVSVFSIAPAVTASVATSFGTVTTFGDW